jgi:hypothetical protein
MYAYKYIGVDVDEYFVQLYTNPQGTNDITLKTLFHWERNSTFFRDLSMKQGSQASSSRAGGVSDLGTGTGRSASAGAGATTRAPEDINVLSDDKVVRSLTKEIKLFSSPTLQTLSSSSPSSSKIKNSSSSSLDKKNHHQHQHYHPKKHFTIVETIGGPLSPGPSHSLQADIYRPLRLPVLLVGDSRLGGITATLSAYESLTLRGEQVSERASVFMSLRI